MKKFLILTLGVWAGSAMADPQAISGFKPSDLTAAASQTQNQSGQYRQSLEDESERLRLGIAYDAAAGVGIRSEVEQILLADALGMSDAATDLRAKWFMSGAIAQKSEGTRTILYNPLARGMLILDWAKNEAGAWQVVAANTVSAEPSGWRQEQNQPYLAAFVADYVAGSAKIGTQSGGYAAMEANRYIAGMAVWLRDPLLQTASEKTRKLINDGRTHKFGGEAIDMMPEPARATYWPIASFERKEGGRSLIYGSALYPQILIAADFDASAKPKLLHLTLVNLANAGTAQ